MRCVKFITLNRRSFVQHLRMNRIVVVWAALIVWALSQQAGSPSEGYRDEIGFALMPGPNSSPITFRCRRVYNDPARPTTGSTISRLEFMSIASGTRPHPANPKQENLFVKYEIAECGFVSDTLIGGIYLRAGYPCTVVDDIWKLGYSTYPYHIQNPPGPGWARFPNHPSEGQQQLLKNYGTNLWNDPIWQENAFKLLHDMQDAGWQGKYAGS